MNWTSWLIKEALLRSFAVTAAYLGYVVRGNITDLDLQCESYDSKLKRLTSSGFGSIIFVNSMM